MWSGKPTIIVKRIAEGKYTWQMYLSNNRKKPTCVSPTVYEDAFRARSRAKAFASKLKTPLRLVDKENNLDEVLLIDETRFKEEFDHDEDELEDVM